MRNYNEKAREMARSVLPSTARKDASETRPTIHGSQRAHERPTPMTRAPGLYRRQFRA